MFKGLAIFFSLVAVAAAIFVACNPILFGFGTGSSLDDYFVYETHSILDRHLAFVRSSIPNGDYRAYRNHCLRVMTFADYFLTSANNKFREQIPQDTMNVIAMALAYHDVALWTDKELDYLKPSIQQMKNYVREEGIFGEEAMVLASEIIDNHHKITDFKSPSTSENNATLTAVFDAIVNAVRKADWADATFGIVRFGLPAAVLEAAYNKIPEAGFHQMLADFGHRLSPDDKLGELKVLRIFKW
ncbi:hypothetical protein ACA910_006683 [Epithemia clementina (nom. ined.)]